MSPLVFQKARVPFAVDEDLKVRMHAKQIGSTPHIHPNIADLPHHYQLPKLTKRLPSTSKLPSTPRRSRSLPLNEDRQRLQLDERGRRRLSILAAESFKRFC